MDLSNNAHRFLGDTISINYMIDRKKEISCCEQKTLVMWLSIGNNNRMLNLYLLIVFFRFDDKILLSFIRVGYFGCAYNTRMDFN